jgi:Ca2+-binding EF-hand superfamily protein
MSNNNLNQKMNGEQLQALLQALNPDVDPEEIKSIAAASMAEIDNDGSGSIDEAEFVSFISSMLTENSTDMALLSIPFSLVENDNNNKVDED